MAEYDSIEFVVEDGLATIALNRPQALNAFTIAMLDELHEALSRVADHPHIRALLITGRGRGFCAGMDLEKGGLTPGRGDAGMILETHLNPILQQIIALSVPVVVAVHGPAAGAGCSLALAGDLVIAADTAYFLQAFVNIGLVPDMGATWILPRLIGTARATAMLLLGERIAAPQALEWGLIYQVVTPEALIGRATALAARLAKGPTQALGLARQTIRASLNGELVDALRMERDNQRIAGLSADFVEGVAAFGERRPPIFTGG